MRVVLRTPTDAACQELEALLAGTFYYSDDMEGSEDVSYTVAESMASQVRQWIEQAKGSGVIDDAEILEAETEEPRLETSPALYTKP